MRNNRSRLFFFCKHECSPSTSAAARPRFLKAGGDNIGRKDRFISSGGVVVNGRVVGPLLGMGIPKVRLEVDGACSIPARIILRCPTSCTVL